MILQQIVAEKVVVENMFTFFKNNFVKIDKSQLFEANIYKFFRHNDYIWVNAKML